MSRTFLSIACHEYGVAALLYLIYLVRPWGVLPVAGRVLVASGMALHAVALGDALAQQGGVTVGLSQGLSAMALLCLAIFLFLDLRYRMPVLGAFLTPIALAVLVPGLLIQGPGAHPPALVRGPLLPLHVSIALLGMAAFVVAAGVAVMYLLMERQMKGKRFGLLFSRLPSLQFLDQLNRRLVVAGFIALSITLVTGAFFASGDRGLFWHAEPREIATLCGWLVFAAVLGARSFAGWQGKRMAVLTMAGFCILVVSFLSSYDPGRHAGIFQ